jgi:hypothetical protein
MIMDAATETGFIETDKDGKRVGTGREGCRGSLKWLYLNEPKTAAALLARVLPFFIEVSEAPPIMSRVYGAGLARWVDRLYATGTSELWNIGLADRGQVHRSKHTILPPPARV